MALVQLPKDFERLTRTADGRLWSDEQNAIFEWFGEGEGNLVVRARAGTGKTSTILEGINRASERKILLAAFNKSIADELQSRLRNPSARAQTLHALGMSFCRRNVVSLEVDAYNRSRGLARAACQQKANRAGLRKAGISTEVTAAVAGLCVKIREILVDPLAELKVAQEAMATDVARAEAFNGFWADMETFAVSFGYEGIEPGYWTLPNLVEAAVMAVDLAKAETKIIDYADMIFLPLVHNWVRPVCDLLVVDEAQDMSAAQLRLAIGATHTTGRICVVGDEKQAIYGFRGADSGSIDRLKAELQANELGLKTTYRCPQKVVAVAQAFAPDFVAAPEAPEGAVHELKLTSKIIDLAEPGDYVLSRVNARLVNVCLELVRAGKRAYIKGSDIGKALVKLFDQLAEDCNNLKAVTKALGVWHKAQIKKAEKLRGPAKTEKYTQVNDQRDLLEAFIEGSRNLADLRSRIENTFVDNQDPDAIMCSSVHKAKGLEADRVFLLGKTFSRDNDEEANICYVAATRAKSALFIAGKTIRQFKAGGGDTPASAWAAAQAQATESVFGSESDFYVRNAEDAFDSAARSDEPDPDPFNDGEPQIEEWGDQ